MGKATGNRVQIGVANVENGATTHTCGTIADRDRYSASAASASEGGAALYARVSSAEQKADLDRQFARLSEFAATKQLRVIDVVKEIGSGLNGHSRAVLRLLRNPGVHTIIVEHRDRLMRFGIEYVEAAMATQDRTLLVIDPDEMNEDIAGDLHEAIVSSRTKARLAIYRLLPVKSRYANRH